MIDEKKITIEKMVEIDPGLTGMSDEDLEELRAALYETAQLGFDVYWWEKGGSKNPMW